MMSYNNTFTRSSSEEGVSEWDDEEEGMEIRTGDQLTEEEDREREHLMVHEPNINDPAKTDRDQRSNKVDGPLMGAEGDDKRSLLSGEDKNDIIQDPLENPFAADANPTQAGIIGAMDPPDGMGPTATPDLEVASNAVDPKQSNAHSEEHLPTKGKEQEDQENCLLHSMNQCVQSKAKLSLLFAAILAINVLSISLTIYGLW